MQAIEIDGSIGEGGGQILRTSLSLAMIYQKSIRISKIRAGRREPGLRSQHLQSVLTASRISGGIIKGAEIGSTQIEFVPGSLPKKFVDLIDTGTAGSVSLILQTVIPVSVFRGVELDLEIRGGTEVPNAPTIDYLSNLVVPVYRDLGASVDLDLIKRGYYPRGGGSVRLRSSRQKDPRPLDLTSGEQASTNILSVSRQLPAHVAKRQAETARELLLQQRISVGKTELDTEGDSLSPGSSILIYQKNSSRSIGASSLGQKGKKAELVGEEAVHSFAREIQSNPNVDSHLADMLVTLLSCVPGKSSFRTSLLSDHFSTNCLVAKKITSCEILTQKSVGAWLVEIAGLPEKPN